MHLIKLLSFLFLIFLLNSCKESTDMPPFNFNCNVKIINKDESSPFKEYKDKIREITVKLLSPLNNDINIDMSYNGYYDCLNIQLQEWGAVNKNNGSYEREYVMEIQFPEEIRDKKDVIRVRILFEKGYPFLKEAYYNDIKPKYMGLDETFFEIEN